MYDHIEWYGQASVKISGKKIIYIDPWKLKGELEKADIILVTHTHFDHLSPDDIAKIQKDDTVVVLPIDGNGKVSGDIRSAMPGDVLELDEVNLMKLRLRQFQHITLGKISIQRAITGLDIL